MGLGLPDLPPGRRHTAADGNACPYRHTNVTAAVDRNAAADLDASADADDDGDAHAGAVLPGRLFLAPGHGALHVGDLPAGPRA
jgi:hypothetical protein